LRSSEQQTHAFQFLLDSIKPRALILHGSVARRKVARILGVDADRLSDTRFAPVATNGRSVMVRAVRHLRSLSYPAAEALGRDLRKALTTSGRHNRR
jgi:hypothetical protein